jgi:DNA-binding transcriptional ArsR family regulator
MTTDHHDPAPPSVPGPTEGAKTPAVDVERADGQASIPVDDRFALLKNWRRRAVLAHLDNHGGHSTLSDLAEVLGAKENEVSRRDLSSSARKRVYVGLYQCHLPRLDDVGVVDFDKRSGDVRLRPEADQLLPYVREEGEADKEAATSTTRERPAAPVGAPARAGLAWATVALLGISVAGIVGTPGAVAALAGLTVLAGLETVAALQADKSSAEEL